MITRNTTFLLAFLPTASVLAMDLPDSPAVTALTDPMQVAILAATAAIILLAFLIVFLTSRSRKRGPFHFPDIPSPQRLGAPYSGGNNAVRNLGPPLP